MTEKFVREEAHDEITRHFWWRVVERLPIPRWMPAEGGWKRVFRPHRGRPRFVPDHCMIHRSVELRMKNVVGYKPTNLPEELDENRFVW